MAGVSALTGVPHVDSSHGRCGLQLWLRVSCRPKAGTSSTCFLAKLSLMVCSVELYVLELHTILMLTLAYESSTGCAFRRWRLPAAMAHAEEPPIPLEECLSEFIG